ncbi:MAG: CBS domain-containing protein [Chitinophagaceae bacterium]|nr:CBS domain-containing protein [Chitinophagaceae bacterium]
MLNKELISESIPTLAFDDHIAHALQLMTEYHVSHLPVVWDNIFQGIISEEDLLNAEDDREVVGKMDQHFTRLSVRNSSHFTEAIKMCNDYNLSIIPVVEEQAVFAGAISRPDLLKALSRISGVDEPGGVIVLELEQKSFSFSEISKLVETNDAQLTQLNTYFDKDSGLFLITLKTNKFEISDIVATFQRYEYHVKYYFGEELYENELKANYDHLMNYLSI